MTSIFAALCAVFFTTLAATAQTVAGPVTSDLNGDGRAERFTLLHTGDGIADLHVENTGGRAVMATDIAWIGGIGQQPELALAPNGSVLLHSMNEAIGRNRWHLTLTIAWRNGAYRVAGYTYDWYDTLNLEDRGRCDLNLLNGRGFVTHGDGAKRAIRTTMPALPVTEWKDDIATPQVCFDR